MNKNCTEENNNCQCGHGASYMANEDYVKGCFGKARIRKAFGKIFHTCEKKKLRTLRQGSGGNPVL